MIVNQKVMAGLMKAVRFHKFGGPSVLQIDEIPKPVVQAHQVLIRVIAAGINPVDTYFRQGIRNPNLPLPHILGSDGAGIVEDTGSNIRKFKVGDRVFFCALFSNPKHGSYAEYTAVDEDNVWSLHEKMTFSQGTAIGTPYLTACRAIISKGNAKSGQKMLIHGASGAVGLGAVQVGRHLGLTIIGTAGTPDGMKLVRDSGAHHAFCHRESNYIDKIKEIGEIDLIVEMLANVNLGKDLPLLAQNGKVLIVGSRGDVSIAPRDTMAKESSIIGVMLYNNTREETRDHMDLVSKGIAEGWVNPVVGEEFPASRIQEAHEQIINNTAGAKGKIVMLFD